MTTEIQQQMDLNHYTLEDLDYYWMENGLPVFMANKDNICDIVESLGYSIYYLLANKTEAITNKNNNNNNNNNKSSTTPPPSPPVYLSTLQLFKVVNNFVGRSITLSNQAFDPTFVSVQETCSYSMPPIPHILIDKLDQFFRLVDAQHGTESIVMLTYDLDKTGSEGWGILVPDQTNTSVHCNYDPHSIAEVKPDNVIIVGSVHSHPGMSAYASGTDHKDQADFDGIHITFGWQKSVNNGSTQYHIELQMSGKAYTLSPEVVFEDYVIDRSPDPDVVEWSQKVKKVLPPSTGGTRAPLSTIGINPQVSTDPGTPPDSSWLNTYQYLPEFNLDEQDYIIVAEVDCEDTIKEVACPSCGKLLEPNDIADGICSFCDIPITIKEQSLATILENLIYYAKMEKKNIELPVYLWAKDPDGTDFVIRIFDNLAHEISDYEYTYSETSLKQYLDESEYEEQGSTVVYHKNVEITPDDLRDFDTVLKDVYVYDPYDHKCSSCVNYYDTNCSRYADQIVIFKQNRSAPEANFESTISSHNCNEYALYSQDNDDYIYS